jgi:hypothetical protein
MPTITEDLQRAFDELAEDIGTENLVTIAAITDEDGQALVDESGDALTYDDEVTLAGLPARRSDRFDFGDGGPRDKSEKIYRVKDASSLSEGQRITVNSLPAVVAMIEGEPNDIFDLVTVRFHE